MNLNLLKRKNFIALKIFIKVLTFYVKEYILY